MPTPAAVWRQAEILLQPFIALRPRPLWKIFGDRLRGLGDRLQPFPGICAHEAENLCNAGQVHARGDVDKHQCGEDIGALVAFGLAFSEQRSNAAERSTNRYWLCTRAAGGVGGGGLRVRGIIRELVGAARHPVGISMTTLIERIGCMAFARDLLRGFVPGAAGLAT